MEDTINVGLQLGTGNAMLNGVMFDPTSKRAAILKLTKPSRCAPLVKAYSQMCSCEATFESSGALPIKLNKVTNSRKVTDHYRKL